MKNFKSKLLTASVSALVASNLYANATNTMIEDLSKNQYITIKGTVDEISSTNEFILRDLSGNTIDVESMSNLNLSQGDVVSVSGQVESQFLGFGKEINASNISVLDKVGSTSYKMNKSNIRMGATNINNNDVNDTNKISNLSNNQKVKIQGKVSSVDYDEKEFTLKDNTGDSIEVSTNQRPTIAEGDMVLVEGKISENMLGMNKINASKVQVSYSY